MTRQEFAGLLAVKQVLIYERSRYESSITYWTTGKGASNSGAQKSIDFCKTRIEAINVAIETIDCYKPE